MKRRKKLIREIIVHGVVITPKEFIHLSGRLVDHKYLGTNASEVRSVFTGQGVEMR